MAENSPYLFENLCRKVDFNCVKTTLLVQDNQHLGRPLAGLSRDAAGPASRYLAQVRNHYQEPMGALRIQRWITHNPSVRGDYNPEEEDTISRVFGSDEQHLVQLCGFLYLFMGLKRPPFMSLALSALPDCFVSQAPHRRPSYLPGKGPSIFIFPTIPSPAPVPVPIGLIHIQCTCQWGDKILDLSCAAHETDQGRIYPLGSRQRAVGDGGYSEQMCIV